MVSLLSPSKLLLAAVAAAMLDAAHSVEFFMSDWVIPQSIGTPYPTMTVNAGDSLTFSWDFGTHDVWIYPSATCDPTGGIQIGTVQDNPTTYTFSEQEAGTTLTFACDVGAHCNAGMIMDVVVLAAAGMEDAADDLEEIIDEVVVETAAPEIVLDDANQVAATSTNAPEDITAVDVDAGAFSVCYVCGDENGSFSNPGASVSLPAEVPGGPPFVVECDQLLQDGLDGKIPEVSCPFISGFAADACGCVNSNFACNICGDDQFGPYEIRSPDANVVLPSDPANAVTCSDLEASGLNGQLDVLQCSEATLYGFQPCQCTPTNFSCSICGEGFKVNNPDVVVDSISLGLDQTYTCAELEVAGAGGVLSPQECLAAESLNRLTNSCGCIPEGGFEECLICGAPDLIPQMPDNNLTLAPFDTNTCEFFDEAGKRGELGPGRCFQAQQQATFGCNCAPSNYTCNVCGGDGLNVTMLYPENNFTVPQTGGGVANCGEVDALGVDGIITPFDCSVISPAVQTQCGCAPTGFMCNICGEDSQMTITEADVAFIPGEATTCGDAQEAGLAGNIDPLRCAAITPFAQVACGCEAGGTVSPVLDEAVPGEVVPESVSTSAPTETGSVMAAPTAMEEITPTNATDTDTTTDASTPSVVDSTPEAENPVTENPVVEESDSVVDSTLTPVTTGETVEEVTEEAVDDTETTAEETAEEEPSVSLQEPPDSTSSALESGSASVSATIGTMLIGAIAAILVVV